MSWFFNCCAKVRKKIFPTSFLTKAIAFKKNVYICCGKICVEFSLKFCQQKTMATSVAVYCVLHNGLSNSTEWKSVPISMARIAKSGSRYSMQ